mmetsp:Transcript_23219/g.58666  ORF Transcript_23219/g.58666 Transcript_23219/m.58666 type:complete len:1794 (+) Transcript_23219:121-5502(+)
MEPDQQTYGEAHFPDVDGTPRLRSGETRTQRLRATSRATMSEIVACYAKYPGPTSRTKNNLSGAGTSVSSRGGHPHGHGQLLAHQLPPPVLDEEGYSSLLSSSTSLGGGTKTRNPGDARDHLLHSRQSQSSRRAPGSAADQLLESRGSSKKSSYSYNRKLLHGDAAGPPSSRAGRRSANSTNTAPVGSSTAPSRGGVHGLTSSRRGSPFLFAEGDGRTANAAKGNGSQKAAASSPAPAPDERELTNDSAFLEVDIPEEEQAHMQEILEEEDALAPSVPVIVVRDMSRAASKITSEVVTKDSGGEDETPRLGSEVVHDLDAPSLIIAAPKRSAGFVGTNDPRRGGDSPQIKDGSSLTAFSSSSSPEGGGGGASSNTRELHDDEDDDIPPVDDILGLPDTSVSGDKSMPPRGRVTRGPTTVSHDHPGHWELIMERDKNQYAQKPNSPPGFEPKGATTSPDEIDGEDRPSSDNIVTTGLDAATSLPLFERNERSQPTTVTHDDAGHWELMHERGQASANARSEQRREVAEFSRQQGGTTGMPQAAKNADATLVRKTGTASSVAAAEVLTAFSDLGRAEPVPYVDADSSSSELQPGREQELRGQNKSRMNYLSPPSVKSTPSKDKQVERREQQRAADAEKPRAAETEGKAERNETTTKPVEEKQTESADVLSPEQQAAIQQYLRDNNTVVTQLKDQIVLVVCKPPSPAPGGNRDTTSRSGSQQQQLQFSQPPRTSATTVRSGPPDPRSNRPSSSPMVRPEIAESGVDILPVGPEMGRQLIAAGAVHVPPLVLEPQRATGGTGSKKKTKTGSNRSSPGGRTSSSPAAERQASKRKGKKAAGKIRGGNQRLLRQVVSGKKNAADGAFEDGFTTFDEDQIKQAGGVLVGGDSSSRRRRSSGVGIFTEARADRSSSSAAGKSSSMAGNTSTFPAARRDRRGPPARGDPPHSAAFVWESRRRPLNLVRLTLSKQNETGKVNILPAGAAFHTHTEWLLETLNRSKEVQVGHDEDFPFFWKQANSSADPLERPLTSLAQLGAVETEKINMKEKKYFPYTGGAALHQALTAMSHELRTVHYEASEKAETSEARLAALRVELEREREKSAFLVKKVAEQHGDLVKMAGFLEENRTKTQTLEGTVAEEQDATRGGQTRRPKSVEDQMLGDICDDILSAEIGKNHDEALMAGARFLERNQTVLASLTTRHSKQFSLEDLYRMGLFPDPLLGRTAGRRDANQHTGASKKHVANAPGTRSTDRLSSFTATSNLLVKERERADAKSRVFSGRDQPASTSIDDQRPTAVPPVGASRALHAEEESASDESSDVSASEQERQTEITFPGRLSAAAASGTKRAPKPYDGDHDVIIKSDYDRPPLVPASTQRHQLHYPTPGRFPNSINGRERPSKAVRTAAARVVQLAFRVYLFRQFRAAIREQNEQTSESEDAVDQLRLFRDEKLARNELQILRNAAVELFHEPYLSENYFNWLVEDLDDVGRLSLGVGAGGEVLDAESHRRKVSALQQLHLTGAHGSTEQRFKSPLIPDALKICVSMVARRHDHEQVEEDRNKLKQERDPRRKAGKARKLSEYVHDENVVKLYYPELREGSRSRRTIGRGRLWKRAEPRGVEGRDEKVKENEKRGRQQKPTVPPQQTQIIPKKKKVAPAEAAVGLGASGAAPRVSPEKILDEIMGVEDTPMISSSTFSGAEKARKDRKRKTTTTSSPPSENKKLRLRAPAPVPPLSQSVLPPGYEPGQKMKVDDSQTEDHDDPASTSEPQRGREQEKKVRRIENLESEISRLKTRLSSSKKRKA